MLINILALMLVNLSKQLRARLFETGHKSHLVIPFVNIKWKVEVRHAARCWSRDA